MRWKYQRSCQLGPGPRPTVRSASRSKSLVRLLASSTDLASQPLLASRKPNGGFERSLQQQVGELLGGVGEGQAFAGAGVELVGDGVELEVVPTAVDLRRRS
jgi:hypothetical protein